MESRPSRTWPWLSMPSLIEPEGFEGECPWIKRVAWGCQKICTGCTDFGRFQLSPSRRGRSARLTGMLGPQETHVGHAPPNPAARGGWGWRAERCRESSQFDGGNGLEHSIPLQQRCAVGPSRRGLGQQMHGFAVEAGEITMAVAPSNGSYPLAQG